MTYTIDGRNASSVLPDLLNLIMNKGETVESRLGESTLELRNIVTTLTNPLERYILTDGRKVSTVAQIAETMWVLGGRDDVAWLKNYLPRAPEFSDDGKVWRGAYGPRLRNWLDSEHMCESCFVSPVDQLAHVVQLLREDPKTRRAVISIYNPTIDASDGKDVPCNNWLHFIFRNNRLHLNVVARSNDVFWGWSGINAFEWSVVLQIVADMLGVQVGEMTFFTSSLHLYDRHWDRSKKIVDIRGEGFDSMALPPKTFSPDSPRTIEDLDKELLAWFVFEEFVRSGTGAWDTWEGLRKFDQITSPLFRQWALAMAWWWTDDDDALRGIADVRLVEALQASPKVVVPKKPVSFPEFRDFVINLHAEKDQAYGDSWKRRGESMGIMANVARKVDRLGVSDSQETSADTAIDLMVYLVKYNMWLLEKHDYLTDIYGERSWSQALSDDESATRRLLNAIHINSMEVEVLLHPSTSQKNIDGAVEYIRFRFEEMEWTFPDHPTHVNSESMSASRVQELVQDRFQILWNILRTTSSLAVALWTMENSAPAEDAWKAGNATRSWAGYGEDDED